METQEVRPSGKRAEHADHHRQSLHDLLTAIGRLTETVQQLHTNLAHLLPGTHPTARVPAPATAPDNRKNLAQARPGTPAVPETKESPEAPESMLSPQEIRVLQLTSRGFSNRRIARELALSEQTVKNYMSTVFRKIGVQSRTEAAYYWTHKGESHPTQSP